MKDPTSKGNTPRKGVKGPPTWDFREYPRDLLITARHEPSKRTVRIRSYEQLGGIRSGQVRRRRALGRAVEARNLYRKGHTRHHVIGLLGICRRTFFYYLSSQYDSTDFSPVQRTCSNSKRLHDGKGRRTRSQYSELRVWGRKRNYFLWDNPSECMACGRADLGFHQVKCRCGMALEKEKERPNRHRLCPLGAIQLFDRGGALLASLYGKAARPRSRMVGQRVIVEV